MSSPKEDCELPKAQNDGKPEEGKPEEEKKIFYCEICEVPCLSSLLLQAHYQGTRHRKMEKALTSGAPVEDPKPPPPPPPPPAIEEPTGPLKKFKKPSRTLKLYVYDTTREPLIGIQHVIENTAADNTEPPFTCELCEFHAELIPLIEHCNSFEHRKAYIAKEYPFLLKVPPAENEDRIKFLRRMALDIERDEGVKMYRSAVLQDDALQFLETLQIDSDPEALSIMTLTQNLTEALKTYCLQKTKSVKATNVTNTPVQVTSANQPIAQETLATGTQPWNPQSLVKNQAPIPAQNRNWPIDSTLQNQQAQYAAGSGNIIPSQLPQQAQYTSEIDNWGRETIQKETIQQAPGAPYNASQFGSSLGRSADPQSYRTNGNPPPIYGRNPNDSELRPFAPNEPRGPGGYPGSRGFGNEYNLSDRGPLPGSLAGGPSPRSFGERIPEYQAYRNNPLTPGIDVRGANWVQEPAGRYMRDPGSRYPTASEGFGAGLSSNYIGGSSNTRMLPDAPPSQQGMGNLGFPKYLQPKSLAPLRTDYDSLRTPAPSDLYRELPRTLSDAGRREKWGQESAGMYMRDFPDRGPLDPSARRLSEGYSAGLSTRMLPANSLASAPLLLHDASRELPRAAQPVKASQGAASGLAADILTLIKGKDVKTASKILTTLAPTHPALKKVNIANLLNLLVQTGTIK